ncbi:MAG: hypothetical protein GVY10_11170 [Verrucomicrobia bacterium]|jgi:Tfp pilus assembly pilus retraction ATPase PilT|nr:hypothetical protein [Verrucomicrobiota bacterium]
MNEGKDRFSYPLFPYEVSPGELRDWFVPEPVGGEEFEEELRRWRSDGEEDSLLRRILARAGGSALAASLGVRYLSHATTPEPAADDASAAQLRRAGFLPLESGRGASRRPVTGGPCLAPALADVLGKKASSWEWVLAFPDKPETKFSLPAGRELSNIADENVRRRRLRDILFALVRHGATDIHVEREETAGCLRAHLEGRMRTLARWDGVEAATCLRILKKWCRFSTAANSLPQDGRIAIEKDGSGIQMRASHLQTHGGESMVLRVHRPLAGKPSLAELGFPRETDAKLLSRARYEPGLYLFTGPTGSGKTTSACALLAAISTEGRKLLTIEDPVERELPCAVQCEVDERGGWTFAAAIRAFLRQDPDILFVGEIRDKATAQAAFRAAITGHTVVATLHATNSRAALERFRAWEIPAGMLAEGLRAMVSQRLVCSGGVTRLEEMRCRFSEEIRTV